MRKTVSQIRDIVHIEEELAENISGVLALNVKDEKLIQLATTFLYQDKNIYFFFDSKTELLEDILFETKASFVIIKNEKVKKNNKLDFNPAYNFSSISVSGLIKKVDDDKLLSTLRKNYLKKYSSKTEDKDRSPRISNVIFIDTEEIQASEETGG